MSAGRLAEVLDAQLDCARAMLAALEREAQALADPRHEGLEEAVAEKDGLARALEALERERLALTETVRDAVGSGNGWTELLALLGRCREHNRRNGALLGARRAGIEMALAALAGGPGHSYGADGRKPLAERSRTLGSA